MHTVNIHEAKTQLSRLIAQAAQGEPFVIAKAGKPLVKVTAIGSGGDVPARRLGFMKGMMQVPPDFDRMGSEAIESLFTGTAP
ncbi:MAG: type II toxin-antitoxin system prevent-host-death family antitoxin [Rhodoferax sp.]|nr:type II toxin-antitoxin system prevent-host-death family antitoxin [Rhodoferax sp.]